MINALARPEKVWEAFKIITSTAGEEHFVNIGGIMRCDIARSVMQQ
jgi:succinyl-CoA synthetase beta subunit